MAMHVRVLTSTQLQDTICYVGNTQMIHSFTLDKKNTYPNKCFNIVQCILCFKGRLSCEERHKTAPYKK